MNVREPLAARGRWSVLRTMLRLRCPHCEQGPVIRRHFDVFERCNGCGFKFCRDGDPAYFGGATFINYMVCGGLVLTTLLVTVFASQPNVPWDLLASTLPALAVAAIVAFYPVSKVIWLTMDVWVRPVEAAELTPRNAESPAAAAPASTA